MVQSLICCQKFAEAGSNRSALKMITVGYYDGPTSGLVECEVCSRVYKFAMVDWDDRQEVRIHALAPISPTAFTRIEQIKERHGPKLWLTVPEIDEILAEAKAPTMVAAFSRWGETVFAARNLTENDVKDVQEWLSLTDPTTARDWFSFLELPRDFKIEREE